MTAHLRSNLLLLGLTFVICSILYPLAVLAVGQGLFPTRASGSLILDPDGKPVGSRLVAQEFKGDEWFQARPSAAGYNAAASGGSNWGANNPKLRDRVARQLGLAVQYRPGTHTTTVQQDIEAWFVAKPDRLPQWVKTCPTSAANWLTDSANTKAVEAWTAATPGDFWGTFAQKHPTAFPAVENDEIRATTNGPAVQAAFFDLWLKDNPAKAKDIERMSADAVTASGSGLDPHITLKNAKEQLDRVVAAWAAKKKLDSAQVRATFEAVLDDSSFEPLMGFVGGEPLVNVLVVNVEMHRRLNGQ